MFKEFKEVTTNMEVTNPDESPLQAKIKNLEEGKVQSRAAIAENEKGINEAEKEIERLRILEKRLQRLQGIKYYENIGDTEKITQLANKINVRDFLESLQDCIEIHFSFSTEDMNFCELSVWQMLYLLFGDLDKLGKKSEPAGDPGAVDPGNVVFDINKKFI